MIYQSSFSEIQSGLSLYTPFQLVQHILRAKHEEGRMNNLYYKDFIRHCQGSQPPYTHEQQQTNQILRFAQSRQYISRYNPMERIKHSIKETILSRARCDVPSPQLTHPYLTALTLCVRVKNFPQPFSHKKLSMNTASTRKSDNKDKLKTMNRVSVNAFSTGEKQLCKSASSILSKINHDLSKMIQDRYSPEGIQKKISLKFHKMEPNKHKHFKSKDKKFKKKLQRENISNIKLNENVQIYLPNDIIEIDQNYGLSLLKKKMPHSQEKRKTKLRLIDSKGKPKNLEKHTNSKSRQIIKTRTGQRNSMSPMTPKPRLGYQCSRQSGWGDYSVNRDSRHSYTSRPIFQKSKSKDSAKIVHKKLLLSPRSQQKIRLKVSAKSGRK